MAWWKEEPLRIIEISTAFDINFSLNKQIETIKKLGGNACHFHCMEHKNRKDDSGLDDYSFYFETRKAKNKNPDILKEFVKLAHKNNIRVIVYFNVHWYKKEFAKRTDWGQIREDGSLIDDVYSTGSSLCINSGYREWVFEILKDMCRYEIDGIFYDGPIFFGNTCYCESCKRLFKEKTGEDLPQKSNYKGPLWKELINFQVESLGRFLKESNEVIKSENPEILFCMNGHPYGPFWPTGRDNREIIKYTDILGAEGGFIYGDLNLTSIYKPAITAKLLNSQSSGKPVIVFDCAGHKPWSWYLLPDKEIKILMYETIANGGNVWLALFPEDIKEKNVIKGISEINKKIKDNKDIFSETSSLSYVALLYPQVSANSYLGSSVLLTDFTKEMRTKRIGDINAEFTGFYEILSRNKAQFDVVDEENLSDLSKYKILILPNARCLSEKHIYRIKEFVKNGGILVSSFETSLYNEKGENLRDFQLSDVFGVNFDGGIFGPNNWDYIFPRSNNDFLNGITKRYIPAVEYGIKTKNKDGKVLIYFFEKLTSNYAGNPKLSDIPFSVINRYKKGLSIYLAGTFGETYYRYRFPEYQNLIKNICENLRCNKLIEVKEEWVDVILRKKGDKVFIHIINLTTGLKRPITYIKEIRDLKINVFIKFKTAYSSFSKEKIKIERHKNFTTLILPVLREYEVFCLEV